MHVGVEEIVTERLREKDLHAVLGQALDVRAAPLQLRDVVDQHAVHALHHHHVLARSSPNTPRARTAGASPSKLRLSCAALRRLAHQVELIENGLLVLAHQLDRPQARRVAPVAIRQVRQRVQHFEVALDQRANAGPHDLDDDFLAVLELRAHAPARWSLRPSGASSKRANTSAGRPLVSQLRRWRAPLRWRTAARGPAASPARRRCLAAAGRDASTASGRTS